MTLRLTVEVLRRGDPETAETLGVIEIQNTQTSRANGPNDEHLYTVRCTPGDASTDRSHPVGRVWHCRSQGWWQLCRAALGIRDTKKARAW